MQDSGLFTIECKDIVLREYRYEDLDAIHALTWQPEIYKWLRDWNVSREQREAWLLHYELPENQKFLEAAVTGEVGDLRLRLVIVHKATDEVIGWCCTGPLDIAPQPGREIMYAISKGHRNKGYTTQAAQGLIRYLFACTNVKKLIAIARTENGPSNRVIQKCGFTFERLFEHDGKPFTFSTLIKQGISKRTRDDERG